MCQKQETKNKEGIKLEYQTQGLHSQVYQACRACENFQGSLQKPDPEARVDIVNELGVWEIFQIEQRVDLEVNVMQATTTKGIAKSRTQDLAFY